MAKKKLGANPKDRLGVNKVNTFLLPSIAVLHAAHAHMYGARIYNPYNWRENKVLASIYISAMERHIQSWKEREECASDSNVHHLGHLIAGAAILLDAQATGNLVDDRPTYSPAYIRELKRLNAQIKEEHDARKFSPKGKSKLHRGRAIRKRV